MLIFEELMRKKRKQMDEKGKKKSSESEEIADLLAQFKIKENEKDKITLVVESSQMSKEDLEKITLYLRAKNITPVSFMDRDGEKTIVINNHSWGGVVKDSCEKFRDEVKDLGVELESIAKYKKT